MYKLANTDLVLEVGSGSNPWPRSDVLLDRYYVDETGQRGGWEIFRDSRPLIVAAGERLPFKDKAFDFVYTCHVIEHAEDISTMLQEMSRVAKAGFIECPNPLLERILDQEQHNWYVTNVNGNLLIARKDKQSNVTTREDRFYFHMMSDHFVVRHHWSKFVTRLYWQDHIDFEVCSDVRRVFDAQEIDPALESSVQQGLSTVLRRAWMDAVNQNLRKRIARIPGNGILRSALRKHVTWRRQLRKARVDAQGLLNLLACPHCRSNLVRRKQEYSCSGCARRFPDADDVSVLL